MSERRDRATFEHAADASVHAALRLATPVLAGLLVFFALADLVTAPPPWTMAVVLFDAAAAAAFGTAWLAQRLGLFAPRHSHAVAASLALFIAVNQLHDMLALADPEQTTYIILTVVGAGAIFLSARWLLALVTFALAGWVGVASQYPDLHWVTFGLALFAACVLALLIQALRISSLKRLESARAAERQGKEELEARERALQEALGALRDSEERHRELVERAPDGFLVVADGRVLYANPTAARLFGAQAASALVGLDATTLVATDDTARFGALAGEVERDGGPAAPAEMIIRRLDGATLPVEIRAHLIEYDGRTAAQVVVRDVTDRKRAEAEREVARERLAEISRLKELDRVKTQFVNTISHELRTPLTPIKVQLHLLKSAKDLDALHRASDVLDRNVARLGGLVDELLEVARIQAGTLRLRHVGLDLGENVGTSVDSFVEVAREEGVLLAAKSEAGVRVVGDPARLQQVVYNLLTNALKFTPRGGAIYVEVRRDGAEAEVSVRDEGVGIPAEKLAQLFEPFSQVHEEPQPGTGLGLFICRGIVEGHGGRIFAQSGGRGEGARFVFRLPLEQAAAAP